MSDPRWEHPEWHKFLDAGRKFTVPAAMRHSADQFHSSVKEIMADWGLTDDDLFPFVAGVAFLNLLLTDEGFDLPTAMIVMTLYSLDTLKMKEQ